MKKQRPVVADGVRGMGLDTYRYRAFSLELVMMHGGPLTGVPVQGPAILPHNYQDFIPEPMKMVATDMARQQGRDMHVSHRKRVREPRLRDCKATASFIPRIG